MNFYENLVNQTQMNYSRYYYIYASGGSPFRMAEPSAIPYEEQIARLVKEIREADCVIVGGASGLSAAGGGDFYYEDNASYRKYFRKFAEKYGFKGAFAGMGHDWKTKLYDEEKVAEIQGDHRFFQCSVCCTDDTWDSTVHIRKMIESMGSGTAIAKELIPQCPHCGKEAFPWVRGYGNFLQGKKYEEQYEKISRYILEHKDKKILFLELGVGRMTPMFIQEPFWNLTLSFPNARYISVNDKYAFLPEQLKDKGMVIVKDIAEVLKDARQVYEEN